MPEALAFGRYQLLNKLATGGMAEIYLARQQGLEGFEKLLVIKRILPTLAEDEEFVRMFLDEARIAARLNHPNVVQIFDLGSIDGSFFIAMEYLHGEDARRVWKQADRMGEVLPPALACRIAMDACAGLDYAHKKVDENGQPLNIVHRDISPQNIIVTFEGGVKVVDFGIAKAADQSSVTKSGVLKGKYSYMSPEQAAGKRVDHRTDQFALGIVLYELLTGERLFKRDTEVATLRAVDACQVSPPSQVNRRVPAGLDPIVLRALARSPDDRFSDCMQLQLALEAWLVENRLPSSSAQLAKFMREVYRDRLGQEQAQGRPLWEGWDSARAEASPAASRGAATAMEKPGSRRGGRPTPGPGSEIHARDPEPGSFVSAVLIDDADDEAAGATYPDTVSTGPAATRPRSARRSPAKPQRAGWLWASAGALTVVALGLAVAAAWRAGLLAPREAAIESRPEAPSRGGSASLPPSTGGIRAGAEALPAPASPAAHAEPVQPADPVRLPEKGPEETVLAASLALRGADAGPGLAAREAAPLPAASPPTDQALAPRPPPSGPAVLVLEGNARQPISVMVDRRRVELPAREKLMPGKHVVSVSSRELDLDETFSVVVHPGETVTRRVDYGVGKVLIVVPLDSYADVYIGGQKRGTTPMAPLVLAEGEHTLLLANPDLGQRMRKSVRIVAGQEARITVSWDSGTP